jgi:hypothetical protein
VSPILVRPVREQFEHDRIIRLLQLRYRRKFEVAINPGSEQNASVNGDYAMYPDVVLFSPERGRRLQGTVEVETGESVNMLECIAEWGPFSRLRAPFFLYVPPNSLDTARRLCAEHQIAVSEIWTYHTAADQVRFTMVHRAPESEQVKVRAEKSAPKAEKSAGAKKTVKANKTARPVKAKAAKKAPAKKTAARKPAKTATRASGGAKKAAKKRR